MANRYLLPVYKKLYDRDFHYSEFNQRMEMQKAIYLLQDMGVPVGDYGFRWYLHGPYSQSLQDDMHQASLRGCADLTLSKEYADGIMRLRDLVHSDRKSNYTISSWVECLASLHYLTKNILSFDAKKEEAVDELEKRKEHLNNHEANLSAYELLKELFV